jgi:cytoskeletal protein CcmA (bactofilin family)
MSLFGSSGRKPEDEPPSREPDVRQRTEPGTSAAEKTGSGLGDRRASNESAQRAGGNPVASFGKSIIFKGDLTGDEDLEIEGRVEGQVKLPNHQLTIGAHGRVTAQVEAKNVVVVGHVSGNVTASERVEVQATGVVDGDIAAPRLLIAEGAVVNGSISMGAAAAKAADAAPPASPASPEPARKTG